MSRFSRSDGSSSLDSNSESATSSSEYGSSITAVDASKSALLAATMLPSDELSAETVMEAVVHKSAATAISTNKSNFMICCFELSCVQSASKMPT